MHPNIYFNFCKNIFNKCDKDGSAIIFSLLPSLDSKIQNREGYFHSIENIPKLIDATIDVFNGNKKRTSNDLQVYNLLKSNSPEIYKIYANFLKNSHLEQNKISNDKLSIALAILSSIYLDTFEKSQQFFLPYSSSCSGQWNLWEDSDYYNLIEKLNDHKEYSKINKEINKDETWDITITEDKFSGVIKMRLIREKAFNKPFSRLAMIKAMIIRMGELGAPNINYETIDTSIRRFFRYLNINEIVRVDREMKFLRELENNISKAIK